MLGTHDLEEYTCCINSLVYKGPAMLSTMTAKSTVIVEKGWEARKLVTVTRESLLESKDGERSGRAEMRAGI